VSEIANSVTGQTSTDEPVGLLEHRIFRVMGATVAVSVVAAAMFASWQVTVGLGLGGALSLLNYHWLQTSVRALLNEAAINRSGITITRYIFRYLLIGAVVIAAYALQWASLAAVIVGLCAFVPALLVEAFRQFYFGIIRREGSY